MGKLLGLVVMVVVVWVCLEVYNEGPDNAFGGAFSFVTAGDDLPQKAVERISTPKRVGKVVDAAVQEGAARYEKFDPDS